MEILGVGPLELIAIFVIMILVLGPNQMVKAVRTMGSFIAKVRKSTLWKELGSIRQLPKTLMDQAELSEEFREFKEFSKELGASGQSIGGEVSKTFDNAWSTTVQKPSVKNSATSSVEKGSNPLPKSGDVKIDTAWSAPAFPETSSDEKTPAAE